MQSTGRAMKISKHDGRLHPAASCPTCCCAAGAIATPLLLDFLASGSGDTVKQITEEGAKLDEHGSSSAATAGPSASTTSSSKPDVGSLNLAEAPASDAAAAAGGSEEEGKLKVPLRRVGQPEEIASAAVWLCMHGQYVTGTDVLVDGGSSCRVLTSSD
jgi:NAD(P)-dependent dehydrogenase (short-subunit alcohol dehydrogenase family)